MKLTDKRFWIFESFEAFDSVAVGLEQELHGGSLHYS